MRILIVGLALLLPACGGDPAGPANPSRLVAGADYSYTVTYTPPGGAEVTWAGRLHLSQLGSRSLAGTWSVPGYFPEATGMVRTVSGLFGGLESQLFLVARWEDGRIEHYVHEVSENLSYCSYYPDSPSREIVRPCRFTLTRR